MVAYINPINKRSLVDYFDREVVQYFIQQRIFKNYNSNERLRSAQL